MRRVGLPGAGVRALCAGALSAVPVVLVMAVGWLHCIVDYHALTITPDPAEMRHGVLDLTATLIAFGLDTERAVLYRQSDLPEVCELTWILGCTCPKGVLNRAHAYKAATADNLAHGRDADHSVGMGLFSYPVLMAADISRGPPRARGRPRGTRPPRRRRR
jgi:tryptophanyl-tRNA synthetase